MWVRSPDGDRTSPSPEQHCLASAAQRHRVSWAGSSRMLQTHAWHWELLTTGWRCGLPCSVLVLVWGSSHTSYMDPDFQEAVCQAGKVKATELLGPSLRNAVISSCSLSQSRSQGHPGFKRRIVSVLQWDGGQKNLKSSASLAYCKLDKPKHQRSRPTKIAAEILTIRPSFSVNRDFSCL